MQRWRSMCLASIVGCSLIMSSLPVLAGTFSPEIDWRHQEQQARIHQGVRSGEITPGEYQRLEREQARILRTEARMKSDGVLTPGERTRLMQMENKASRNIYRAKHNGRRL